MNRFSPEAEQLSVMGGYSVPASLLFPRKPRKLSSGFDNEELIRLNEIKNNKIRSRNSLRAAYENKFLGPTGGRVSPSIGRGYQSDYLMGGISTKDVMYPTSGGTGGAARGGSGYLVKAVASALVEEMALSQRSLSPALVERNFQGGAMQNAISTAGIKTPLSSGHLRYNRSGSGLEETPASAEMKDKAVSAVERVYKAAGEAFSDNDTQMTAITFGMKEGANDAWSAAGQGVVDALADNLAQRKEIADAYRHPSRADDQRWHFSEVGPYKDFSGKKAEINDAINLAYHSIDIAKEAIKKFDEVRSVTQGSIPSSLIDEEEYLYEKIEILKNSVGYSVNQLNQIVKKYIQPHLDNPTEEGLAGASASAASERERLSRLEEQSNEVVLLIEDFLSKMKSSVQEAASPLVFELSSQKRSQGGLIVGPSHAQGGVSLGVVNGVHQEAEGESTFSEGIL